MQNNRQLYKNMVINQRKVIKTSKNLFNSMVEGTDDKQRVSLCDQ